MNVGVVGASGYSGELLVRLLLGHPHVRLTTVTSRTHAGKPLQQVIPSLRGADHGLAFTDSNAKPSPPAIWTLCFWRCRMEQPPILQRSWCLRARRSST
jgi:N-acetyl-gamma-glutamylphosphate reductase